MVECCDRTQRKDPSRAQGRSTSSTQVKDDRGKQDSYEEEASHFACNTLWACWMVTRPG
jgi:hypothetical protein